MIVVHALRATKETREIEIGIEVFLKKHFE